MISKLGFFAITPEQGQALLELVSELHESYQHPTWRNPHEGIGVVLEEFEELKAEAFRRSPDKAAMRREAYQLAAMALRFALDICSVDSGTGGVALTVCTGSANPMAVTPPHGCNDPICAGDREDP